MSDQRDDEQSPKSGRKAKRVAVTVSVADDHMAEFDKVVRRCVRAGLAVEQQLRTVGVISGSIAETKLAALEALEGVAAVEVARSIQLPPPDSEVQ